MRTESRAYPWLIVALLWAVWLINYLDRQLVFSVFPLLKQELRLSDAQLGLVSGVFLWVYAFSSPVAGYLADRLGHKKLIVASLLVWSAVTWATGHVRTYPELLITRGLMGISEACYLPAGLAMIAAWHGTGTRSIATGIHYSGAYIGMVSGGVLGGWMGTQFGWRSAFLGLGAAGVAYAVLLFLLLREGKREHAQHSKVVNLRHAILQLFRTPGFLCLFGVFAAISIGNWIVYTWLPFYLNERFGMDLASAGFNATFYLQLGAAAGILAGGRLADKWQRPGARILVQAFGLLVAAPFLFLSGFTASLTWLICGMLVFGFGRGTFDANCMPALCEISPVNLRATGYGLFNFIGPFAGGLFAAGAGALRQAIGIGGALEISGALLGLSSLLLLRIQTAEPKVAVVS